MYVCLCVTHIPCTAFHTPKLLDCISVDHCSGLMTKSASVSTCPSFFFFFTRAVGQKPWWQSKFLPHFLSPLLHRGSLHSSQCPTPTPTSLMTSFCSTALEKEPRASFINEHSTTDPHPGSSHEVFLPNKAEAVASPLLSHPPSCP